MSAIRIRSLDLHEELAEAVRLQKEIWGFEEIELLPVRLFVVATKVGGQVFGAFDGDAMVGFLLAIPGIKPGGSSYLHSHMMGVQREYRNRGIGRMLKLRQRQDALERGVKLIEWTFDPLELKNAFFNVERLGAVIRRYVFNQYGTTTSHLHGGLPTDRCVAEWYVASRRTEAMIEGNRPADEIAERIEIPLNIADLRQRDPVVAREIQRRAGEQFSQYFSDGLAVVGFQTASDSGIYLLRRWRSE